MSDPLPRPLSRRDLLRGIAGIGVGAAFGGCAGPLHDGTDRPAKPNAITRENARPGTRDWMLTSPRGFSE